jgi:hypothetical protein
MTRFARRARSARGAELIEFALVLPVLLLIVLGIVDFGFMFQRMEVVTNAAREGARLAVLPGYQIGDVQARVCDYLRTGGVPLVGSCPLPSNPTISVVMNFPIGLPGGGTLTGKRVIVTYTHNYLFIGPIASLFGGTFSSVPVRGVAIMRDEAGAAP